MYTVVNLFRVTVIWVSTMVGFCLHYYMAYCIVQCLYFI